MQRAADSLEREENAAVAAPRSSYGKSGGDASASKSSSPYEGIASKSSSPYGGKGIFGSKGMSGGMEGRPEEGRHEYELLSRVSAAMKRDDVLIQRQQQQLQQQQNLIATLRQEVSSLKTELAQHKALQG